PHKLRRNSLNPKRVLLRLTPCIRGSIRTRRAHVSRTAFLVWLPAQAQSRRPLRPATEATRSQKAAPLAKPRARHTEPHPPAACPVSSAPPPPPHRCARRFRRRPRPPSPPADERPAAPAGPQNRKTPPATRRR